MLTRLGRCPSSVVARTIRSLGVVTALVVLLTACGDNDVDESVEDTSTTIAAEAAPEPTDEVGGSIVGALPTEFEPSNLVTLDPLLYQAALAMGVAPIGTPTFETAAGVGAPLPDYLPAEVVDEAELFGTILTPNVEAVAAAGPDLVLGTAQFAPPVSQGLDATTDVALYEGAFTDWRAATTFVGAQVGRDGEASALIAAIDERVASLAPEASGTASIVRFTGPDVLPINETAVGGELLVGAGFTLPEELAALSPAQSLSLEQIELLDADVIVVVLQEGSDTVSGPDQYDDWVASPLWEALPAVQRGDVVEVGPCWATPTVWCAAIVTDDIEEIIG